ncbi:porin family protein [Marivirga sp.]|uniref:porin family protein n=1 Tax=Marivirga sp. TaxID=2018662 RepID=UPI003DA72FFA
MSKFLLCIFLIFVSYTISAQEAPLGIRAGANFSTIAGDAENVSPKLGGHIGIFSVLPLSEKFSINPELSVSNQGAKSSDNREISFSFWYINAPILLKYQNNSSFFLNTGIQFGTVFTANYKESNQKENITAQLENFDFALALGLGYEISKYGSLELRYNHGFSNYSRTTGVNGEKFFNRVIQFSFAYVIFK